MNQSGNPFGNPLFNLPDMGNFDKTLREAMSKLPMAPDLGRAGAQMQGMGQSMADAFRTLSQLQISPAELGRIQTEYLRQAAELWNSSLTNGGKVSLPKDRRFSSPEWADNPLAGFSAANYLLNARTLMELAEAVQGDEKSKARIRFAVQQWIDAAAPSNYLALNPEAQKKALDTKGESITHGMNQLLHDMKQGHVSQTDESVFEVGRNVATSEGAVVFHPRQRGQQPVDARLHAVQQRLLGQRVLRREVRVEAADGKPGVAHDRLDGRRLHAPGLHHPAGGGKDPPPRLGLVLARVP